VDRSGSDGCCWNPASEMGAVVDDDGLFVKTP
jgi:hypothetical protein